MLFIFLTCILFWPSTDGTRRLCTAYNSGGNYKQEGLSFLFVFVLRSHGQHTLPSQTRESCISSRIQALLKTLPRCRSQVRKAAVLTGLTLCGNADDTASGAGPGVASLLALLVAALAEVVGASVDDDGALHKMNRQHSGSRSVEKRVGRSGVGEGMYARPRRCARRST